MLSQCLLTKISASELSWKFIESALLVGNTHSPYRRKSQAPQFMAVQSTFKKVKSAGDKKRICIKDFTAIGVFFFYCYV